MISYVEEREKVDKRYKKKIKCAFGTVGNLRIQAVTHLLYVLELQSEQFYVN